MIAEEGGFVHPFSIAKGDTVKLHLSSGISSFTINIFKIDSSARFVAQFPNVSASIQPLQDSAFYYGANWNETFRFIVPDNWTSGIYRAEFPAVEGGYRGVLFIVREKQLGNHSKNLLVLSTNTWQAYNSFGGKSLYEYNSTNLIRAHSVSMKRPAAYPLGRDGSADFYKYEFKFIQWLTKNNISFELATQIELDENPDYLKNYNLVMLAGHNEYWTRRERIQLENYVEVGGKLIILGGNTCWWQVRFEDNGNRMICYKDRLLDPLDGISDSIVTTNWWKEPVNFPENKLTGVSFRNGGFVNTLFGNEIVLPADSGYGDYAAFNTHHWIFNGTGLIDGDEFGQSSTIVGYEIDGAEFIWNNGLPIITGNDGTPSSFKILGVSPAINYNTAFGKTHGTMGIYHNSSGGVVFNSATTDWVDGLYSNPDAGFTTDPVVAKVTLNVIGRFLGNKFPPDITNWIPANTKSKMINGELLSISNRDLLIKPGESESFSITADDPMNLPVQYKWRLNNIIISQFSSYNFFNSESNVGPKKYELKATAFNSNDSTTISWNIFNSELVFSSDTVITFKTSSAISYQLKTFNFYNDNLQYSFLSGVPSWLTITPSGLLEGIAPAAAGTYQVTIRVTNQHSQLDVKNFTLNISDIVSGIKDEFLPEIFTLYQNYPNPFNPTTNIRFRIAEPGFVSLKIYDVLGNEIAALINNDLSSGEYEIPFNAALYGLSSGIYFYKLLTGSFTSVKRMSLVK